jgi:hypothetical protein
LDYLLASILDIYWNLRDAFTCNQRSPPLALVKANSRPATDPEYALSFELTALVSSGRMDPEEAIEAQSEADGDYEDDSSGDTDDVSTDDDEFSSDVDDLVEVFGCGSPLKCLTY